MIEQRITWTWTVEGERKTESGRVVAVQKLSTHPSWSLLTLTDDGRFLSPPLDIVRAEMGDDAKLLREAQETLAGYEYLERFIAEQFPDVEDAGGGPVERAQQLLLDLKTELLTVGAERDNFRDGAAREKTRADARATEIEHNRERIANLERELAAARKKTETGKNKNKTPTEEPSS